MKAEFPWGKKTKRLFVIYTALYSQKISIPDSIFWHHYIGILCGDNSISGWWQIWMLFTHNRAALDRQGSVRRRAAYYHSAATPAFHSARAGRNDTSVSFPVTSRLSVWQRLKRFLEYLMTIATGKKEKKNITGKIESVKLFIRVFWSHALHWSLSETGRYGTRQKCLTWLHGFVSNSKRVTVKRDVTWNRGHQHIDGKTISIRVLYFYFLSLHTYEIFICWSLACRY